MREWEGWGFRGNSLKNPKILRTGRGFVADLRVLK
jgi:hypothetical protein